MDNWIQSQPIRNRAWRRWQNRRPSHANHGKPNRWKPDKDWKMIGRRRAKCHRAHQLGFIYPVRQHDVMAEWFD